MCMLSDVGAFKMLIFSYLAGGGSGGSSAPQVLYLPTVSVSSRFYLCLTTTPQQSGHNWKRRQQQKKSSHRLCRQIKFASTNRRSVEHGMGELMVWGAVQTLLMESKLQQNWMFRMIKHYVRGIFSLALSLPLCLMYEIGGTLLPMALSFRS